MTPKQQQIRDAIIRRHWAVCAEEWIKTYEWSTDDTDTVEAVEAALTNDIMFGWDDDWGMEAEDAR